MLRLSANRFMRCRRGATMIEYALIAALVSILAIAGFQAVASSLSANYFALIGSIPR